MTETLTKTKKASTPKVSFGGASSAGCKALNQDAFAAYTPQGNELRYKGIAAAIADGVSSCSDSQVASQTCVTGFIQDYFATPENWSTLQSASRVLTGLNNWLHKENTQVRQDLDSLLCTFTATVVKSSTLHWFHVGDSRLYYIHGKDVNLLTSDHNRREAGKNYLARAMGADKRVEVDYGTHLLEAQSKLLLTTDGVHNFVSNAQIRETLSDDTLSPEGMAQKLIDLATEQGSDDNLTALIVAIDELPDATLEESFKRVTELPIPPALSVGNKIDSYEVLDVVFSGTRSHMYHVKELESGQQSVLKAPSINFADDPVYLDGFIREEWVGLKLNHPNIMKTYKPAGEKNFLYYLGEYIEGSTLRDWMNDNPQPSLDAVRRITNQVIQGLRAFQRADMIHQDLKPENIMIDRDGRVKILDFGTVRIAGIEEMTSPLDKSVPQGSVNYIAPEYLIQAPATFKADLFSLGVIVYEMLTGELPFEERSVNQTSIKHYGEFDYTPAIQHRKDLPFWMEGCLRKALQPNPAHRYNAYSEFLQDFTSPNRQLELQVNKQPLIERNPTRVWQGIALILFIVNLVQLALNNAPI